MTLRSPANFEVRLAQTADDLRAAQRLRYDVFVDELGANGPLVDHVARLECDEFDPHYDHLLLFDHLRDSDPVVGAYRLLSSDQMPLIGRYYSETEFDLSALKTSGRKLLELGRSCVHRDYRGGSAMAQLWVGLADYVRDHGIDILFGVASFHGTDVNQLAQPLSMLHQFHAAPAALSARAQDGVYQTMDLLPVDHINRKQAMIDTPSLIKAYLRLGGQVGDGAYLDHAFNTTDVCLIMDTQTMNARHRRFYERQVSA